MKNLFAKTRPVENPYAIYRAGGIFWHVCKTYKTPANETKDQYARWFVWTKSPMTYGEFEGGDVVVVFVKRYGQLVAAEPEWLEAYGIPKAGRWTPSEYLAETPLEVN
jgi:hypothetical protein